MAFDEADTANEVTAGTWARLLDPNSGMDGPARRTGRDAVVGFTVSALHRAHGRFSCYLEDLFIHPEARGHGLGHALIDDLVALGLDRSGSRLYWNTRQ